MAALMRARMSAAESSIESASSCCLKEVMASLGALLFLGETGSVSDGGSEGGREGDDFGGGNMLVSLAAAARREGIGGEGESVGEEEWVDMDIVLMWQLLHFPTIDHQY
jgi:hypothetical protein